MVMSSWARPKSSSHWPRRSRSMVRNIFSAAITLSAISLRVDTSPSKNWVPISSVSGDGETCPLIQGSACGTSTGGERPEAATFWPEARSCRMSLTSCDRISGCGTTRPSTCEAPGFWGIESASVPRLASVCSCSPSLYSALEFAVVFLLLRTSFNRQLSEFTSPPSVCDKVRDTFVAVRAKLPSPLSGDVFVAPRNWSTVAKSWRVPDSQKLSNCCVCNRRFWRSPFACRNSISLERMIWRSLCISSSFSLD
mmetsp:Transcript_21149/g.56365  ORF Transcript_21149/g.56365 Transcript_21149/m.56365 type:complete len:253 (+) Transcript_21149:692-1450(+)